MTRRLNVIVCIALSFMFLFISIGYSAYTDQLSIRGDADIRVPEGLFIIDIQTDETSNIDHQTATFTQYTTTVDSIIDKKDDTTTTSNSRPGRPGTTTTTKYSGSVTYEITVFNNTKHEYAYRGLFYQKSLSGYNGNSKVDTKTGDDKLGVVVSFPNNDKIVGPSETLTFTVTYTVGKNMDSKTDWKTLINFQFGINVESEAAAIDAVHAKFLNILNTKVTYNELVDKIDDKYDGSQEWTSNYIGNVSDAVDADSMTVETLFAGQLNMIIGGQVKPATVLIKHENLDNNTKTGDDYVAVNSNGNGSPFYGYGCEMTLYLTTDQLNKANSNAPVYVTVFTCDRDADGNIVGDWYQIGESYIGKAPVVGYKGESGGTGSFVTDNWVSDRATYKVTDRYSYTVNQGTTIKDLTRVVDQNAINELQRLFNEAKELIEDMRYAGVGIELIEEAYSAASRYYTLDGSGNPVATQGITRAQLLPTIRNLDHSVSEAKQVIENLNKQ